jgi:glycosyltransferase involved in cell wall biosynthesis
MSGERKIRVLRIIGECKTGGTETIALNYYRNLEHNKIAMDFLFYGESIARFNNELQLYSDNVINVTNYKENIVKSIIEIRNVVRNGNYDIVHAQLNALNMFPLMGAWLGGAKIRIASNHSTANLKYETTKSIVKYILKPTTKIFATKYAACSKYAGEWCFGKRALKKGKITVIHNAIDLDEFSFNDDIRMDVRKELKWEASLVIGHAGRFIEQKNHKLILEIFNAIHQKCPNSLLVLVGGGELLDDIKATVHKMRLDNCVQFLGIRFDMNRLMQGMDVFLFPSLYEGLGNVLTEVQAVGLHSVASDAVPNEVKMTDLVDIIPLNAPIDEWAEAVLKYNDGYKREDTHSILKANGYEIKSASIELEKYYEGLLVNE